MRRAILFSPSEEESSRWDGMKEYSGRREHAGEVFVHISLEEMESYSRYSQCCEQLHRESCVCERVLPRKVWRRRGKAWLFLSGEDVNIVMFCKCNRDNYRSWDASVIPIAFWKSSSSKRHSHKHSQQRRFIVITKKGFSSVFGNRCNKLLRSQTLKFTADEKVHVLFLQPIDDTLWP